MSYGVSAALQSAIYQHLLNDPSISSLVGSDIYDALPSGTIPGTYVTLGPETAEDRSDKTGWGAEHRFVISVVTSSAGFSTAKTVAAMISDAMRDPSLTLSRGRLVAMNFVRAVAARSGKGAERRIDLTFRARVEDN